jgi:hypothetical protein
VVDGPQYTVDTRAGKDDGPRIRRKRHPPWSCRRESNHATPNIDRAEGVIEHEDLVGERDAHRKAPRSTRGMPSDAVQEMPSELWR